MSLTDRFIVSTFFWRLYEFGDMPISIPHEWRMVAAITFGLLFGGLWHFVNGQQRKHGVQ